MRSPPTVMLPPRGRIEAADQVEQRGLAGSRRTHERDEIPGLDVQIDAVQDFDLLRAARVGLAEILDLDQGIHWTPPDCRLRHRSFARRRDADPSRHRAARRAAPAPRARRRRVPVTARRSPNAWPACDRRARAPHRPRRHTPPLPPDRRRRPAPRRAPARRLSPAARRAGRAAARFRRSRNDTRTPMSGRMRGSFWSSATRTLTVALLRSAVGMIAITCAGMFQSG